MIRLNDAGFELRSGGRAEFAVRWDDVVEIAAFKRDLFTCDEICLGFRTRGGDEFWSVGEDDAGFEGVVTELERRFSGIRTDWRAAVMKPAFRENWTRIWCRPKAG